MGGGHSVLWAGYGQGLNWGHLQRDPHTQQWAFAPGQIYWWVVLGVCKASGHRGGLSSGSRLALQWVRRKGNPHLLPSKPLHGLKIHVLLSACLFFSASPPTCLGSAPPEAGGLLEHRARHPWALLKVGILAVGVGMWTLPFWTPARSTRIISSAPMLQRSREGFQN